MDSSEPRPPTHHVGDPGQHGSAEGPLAAPVEAIGRLPGTAGGAYLLMMVLVVVWGSHWTITKVGLQDLPPFVYGALRLALAIAVVAGMAAARGRLRRPSRRDLPVVLSVGIGQIAVGIVSANVALQFVPAGRSSVLVYTTPLWVALMLAIGWRERLSRMEVIGLALGLLGIGLLVNPTAIDWRSSDVLIGTSLLLGNAIIGGATFIHVRRHRWQASPLDLLPWQLLVALVPLALLAFVLERDAPIHWQPSTVLIVVYSGVPATAFAFWASQSIIRALGPMVTSVGFLATPVVGLIVAAIALGEPVSDMDLIAIFVTVAGIATVSLASRTARALRSTTDGRSRPDPQPTGARQG